MLKRWFFFIMALLIAGFLAQAVADPPEKQRCRTTECE